MLQKGIVFILLILTSFSGFTVEEKKLAYTQNLTISDGLAHNGVTSILEDSKGFLWIGTYDGLNRYDGYECKVYRNTLDKELFVSNRIRTIAEDNYGNLWLGTDEGISIYNPSLEKYTNIYSNKLSNKGINGPIVRKILFDKNSKQVICATEGDGILVFNNNFTFSGQYFPPNTFDNKPVLFYDGLELDDSKYLFSTSSGLYIFEVKYGKFQKILENEIDHCKSIIRIDNNTLLANLLNGVAIIDHNEDENGISFKLKFKDLMSYQFNSVSIDYFGGLWLGSIAQGAIYLDNVQAFINNKPFKQATFTAESGRLRVSSIFPSASSGCWIGTFNKGLFRFDLKENPFKSYNARMNYDFGIQTNEISHAGILDENRIYISALRGGLALFNTQQQKFESLPFYRPNNSIFNTGAVFVDSKQNTWLKVAGAMGLCIVKNGSTKMEKVISIEIPLINQSNPRSIVEDKKGNIWLGCTDDVYRITLNKTGDITNIESLKNNSFFMNKIIALGRTIYADPLYDFIWFGTDTDGLFRIDITGNKPLKVAEIKQFANDRNNKKSISSNFVSSIVRLPNTELWIGTERGGIDKALNSNKEPEFISFSEKQGLSNNVVKSILYDDEYNLWISTNNGLNKFNTKDFTFRTFKKEDGLPFEDFTYSSAKLKNGLFVFSGMEGFCYFKPEEISNKEAIPRLEFGEFKLHNRTVFPGDTIHNRILLNKSLSNLDEITLKHNENVFSIELISLHFSTPENHRLKYQLSPISEEWIDIPSSQRFIYYNGIQPGEYEFRVMASNSLNEWTETKNLKIIVTPPFWKTPLSFAIYFLVFATILYSIMHYLLRLNSLKHKLQIEQFEKDKVKEVNAAKLRFFSNISHEIKTPLTLISGPIDILAERFSRNSDVIEKLGIVQRQSKKISQLVDQVHDFQKSEANKLTMNYSRFCFDTFINDLISDFVFLAKNDKKHLKAIGDDSKIFVSADKDKLEKIFNNLINNAFKFTNANDSIVIDYKRDNKNIIVKVEDTGNGIDSEDLPHIFKRFYRSQKKQSAYIGGSGIGLAFTKRLVEMHYGYIHAESELNKGTSIIFRLPVIIDEIFEDNQENERKIILAEKEFVPEKRLIKDVDLSRIKVAGEFSDSLIFLAEDNTEMRTFVSGVLSNFFRIKTFENGQECLIAMEEEWPDIVISDVLMPKINGFDMCKKIKSDLKTSHIPVILLTACTAIEEQIQGLEVGADAYIKKPFDIQYLVTRTETLLRNRKVLRERFSTNFPLTLKKSDDSGTDFAFLEKLYSLMAENLDNQNLDINLFARKLFLNRTHFYQKVKALTNQTPFEFLKTYRLKKAAELLVQEKLSVNDVYVMTGFKSRTHFSKLFKETFGVSPGKYTPDSN